MKKRSRHRLVNITVEDGKFIVDGEGKWWSYWRDPYHLILVVPWPMFLGIIVLIYIAINFLFALLYLAIGDGIANARPGSFWDAYFFSVQTLASIGYGAMYPQTFPAHLIVSLEAMVGLVSIALLTGVSFARFSRSTARVVFSRVAVIAPHDGIPTLMIRAANERGNQILEAQARLTLLRDEITPEGQPFRRIYDLALVRERTFSFSIGWTMMHRITPASPLYGITAEGLIQCNTTLIATVLGTDETVVQTLHARHDYSAKEILLNHRFADMITFVSSTRRLIDYSMIHEVIPL